jgi:hypothetical protein
MRLTMDKKKKREKKEREKYTNKRRIKIITILI